MNDQFSAFEFQLEPMPRQFSDAERTSIIDAISRNFLVLPTGSRVICPEVCTDASDWDFCIYPLHTDQNVWMGMLSTLQFEESLGDLAYGPDEDRHRFFRRESINLIVVKETADFNSWNMATAACKAMKVTEKLHRKLIFSLYLGETNNVHVLTEKVVQ